MLSPETTILLHAENYFENMPIKQYKKVNIFLIKTIKQHRTASTAVLQNKKKS